MGGGIVPLYRRISAAVFYSYETLHAYQRYLPKRIYQTWSLWLEGFIYTYFFTAVFLISNSDEISALSLYGVDIPSEKTPNR